MFKHFCKGKIVFDLVKGNQIFPFLYIFNFKKNLKIYFPPLRLSSSLEETSYV